MIKEDVFKEIFDKVGFKRERYDLLFKYFKQHVDIELDLSVVKPISILTLPIALQILNDLEMIDNINIINNSEDIINTKFTINFDGVDLIEMGHMGADVDAMVMSKIRNEIIEYLNIKSRTKIIDIYILLSDIQKNGNSFDVMCKFNMIN